MIGVGDSSSSVTAIVVFFLRAFYLEGVLK
jgi:hypothetical protein